MSQVVNIQNYLNNSFFIDVNNNFNQTIIKTGFTNIDEKTGFYPGLYILGAISSLGKTTFVHQMCDQIAKSGKSILYISLEQSILELTSKSLSRITAKNDMSTACNALKIRNGEQCPQISKAINEYNKFADKINIVECTFGITMSEIESIIINFTNHSESNPIIVIDYLQAIHSDQNLQSVRESIDTHVQQLKSLQIRLNTPIIAISSLNRQNYYSQLDFDSFKESGGIEYTADVVWGLQLKIIHNPIFDKQGSVNTKREMLGNAKSQIPREIEFVCLKNRFGISGYTCDFDYYPQFDYFLSK